jgi:hypothetical protein
MSHWPLAFLEFFVVIAFGIGWLILELYCKRLDKPAEPPSIESASRMPADHMTGPRAAD